MKALDLAQHARVLVADWPPLTEQVRGDIAALMRPSAPNPTVLHASPRASRARAAAA